MFFFFFLSVSLQIRFHLQDCQQWFVVLAKYLGLLKATEIPVSPSDQALNWAGQDPHTVVKGWLNFIMTCKDKSAIRVSFSTGFISAHLHRSLLLLACSVGIQLLAEFISNLVLLLLCQNILLLRSSCQFC